MDAKLMEHFLDKLYNASKKLSDSCGYNYDDMFWGEDAKYHLDDLLEEIKKEMDFKGY